MKFYTRDRSTSGKPNTFRYFVTSKISENIHETPEGYLVCIGVPIARTGEMLYGEGETPLETDEQGKVVIERAEAEVFRPETIASFEGKPVTITHPTEFVDPKNWKELAKGVLQNVRRGEGENKNDLIADLLITDSVAINLVKNGLREVSCGYEAEYTQTEEGRGVQTKIIGNHLALVDQGRAGSAYAINDHKGVLKMGKLGEKIKAIFTKAQDEAMKVANDESTGEKPVEEKETKSADASAYDELVNVVKDLSAKVAAMGKPADATSPAAGAQGEKEVEEGQDEEAGGEASMEDRMKALEAAVSKILEQLSAKAGDEEAEASDEESEEESEDDDFEESSMVGDTASRVEILAPGMKLTKDAKAKALKTAYATKDGKKVIDALTGGKAPAFDSAERVDALFIAASEVLKAQRTSDLSKTKQVRDSDTAGDSSGPMTAEKMNEINAKHYKR